MIKRVLALFLVLAVFAASCGSDDDSTETSDTAPATTQAAADEPAETEAPADTEPVVEPVEDFSGDENSEFCQKARELDENDPFENFNPLAGASFVEEAEALYGEVIPMAPDEIRGDFETTLDGIRQMGSILASYDYNFLDEDLGAEMDALDTTEMELASDRIGAYLEDVCGIEDALEADVDDLGGLFPEGIDPTDLEDTDIDSDAAQAIFEQFGISEELAACLNEELGSDFDFDTAATDASFLSQPICGTTILEIISGIGGAG